MNHFSRSFMCMCLVSNVVWVTYLTGEKNFGSCQRSLCSVRISAPPYPLCNVRFLRKMIPILLIGQRLPYKKRISSVPLFGRGECCLMQNPTFILILHLRSLFLAKACCSFVPEVHFTFYHILIRPQQPVPMAYLQFY